MNTNQIQACLAELAAKLTGKYPRVSLVITSDGSFGLYANNDAFNEIYKGHGDNLHKMLVECEAAIDAAHPDVLARTLGVEVAA